MKNLKRILAVAIIALGMNTINAQSSVGHVNLGEIIQLMPETKKMNEDLEKLGKTYEDELVAKQAALEALTKRYTTEAATQTEEENQKRALEVQTEQQKIQMGYQVAQQDIEKKGNELMEPIIKKARQAVDDVAAELKLDYILDANSIITANGTDITAKVKAKLGIQ